MWPRTFTTGQVILVYSNLDLKFDETLSLMEMEVMADLKIYK